MFSHSGSDVLTQSISRISRIRVSSGSHPTVSPYHRMYPEALPEPDQACSPPTRIETPQLLRQGRNTNPSRPPNAFILFRTDYIKKKKKDKKPQQTLSKEASLVWKAMNATEKDKVWKVKYEEAKAKWELLIKAGVYTRKAPKPRRRNAKLILKKTVRKSKPCDKLKATSQTPHYLGEAPGTSTSSVSYPYQRHAANATGCDARAGSNLLPTPPYTDDDTDSNPDIWAASSFLPIAPSTPYFNPAGNQVPYELVPKDFCMHGPSTSYEVPADNDVVYSFDPHNWYIPTPPSEFTSSLSSDATQSDYGEYYMTQFALPSPSSSRASSEMIDFPHLAAAVAAPEVLMHPPTSSERFIPRTVDQSMLTASNANNPGYSVDARRKVRPESKGIKKPIQRKKRSKVSLQIGPVNPPPSPVKIQSQVHDQLSDFDFGNWGGPLSSSDLNMPVEELVRGSYSSGAASSSVPMDEFPSFDWSIPAEANAYSQGISTLNSNPPPDAFWNAGGSEADFDILDLGEGSSQDSSLSEEEMREFFGETN